jgi:hypothetical protein
MELEQVDEGVPLPEIQQGTRPEELGVHLKAGNKRATRAAALAFAYA